MNNTIELNIDKLLVETLNITEFNKENQETVAKKVKDILQTALEGIKFKIQLNSDTIDLLAQELNSIPAKYQKPFNSTHEGYAVLLEEVRELENEIFFGEKRDSENHKENIKKEAVQVAAMAVRIIQELT